MEQNSLCLLPGLLTMTHAITMVLLLKTSVKKFLSSQPLSVPKESVIAKKSHVNVNVNGAYTLVNNASLRWNFETFFDIQVQKCLSCSDENLAYKICCDCIWWRFGFTLDSNSGFCLKFRGNGKKYTFKWKNVGGSGYKIFSRVNRGLLCYEIYQSTEKVSA